MRSVNAGVKTYIRGTRIPFGKDKQVIRVGIIHSIMKDHVGIDCKKYGANTWQTCFLYGSTANAVERSAKTLLANIEEDCTE